MVTSIKEVPKFHEQGQILHNVVHTGKLNDASIVFLGDNCIVLFAPSKFSWTPEPKGDIPRDPDIVLIEGILVLIENVEES